MKDYNCAEIGMLAGAAIGGAVAVLGFTLTSNILFFIVALLGVVIGVTIGNRLDRNKIQGNKQESIWGLSANLIVLVDDYDKIWWIGINRFFFSDNIGMNISK